MAGISFNIDPFREEELLDLRRRGANAEKFKKKAGFILKRAKMLNLSSGQVMYLKSSSISGSAFMELQKLNRS